MPFLTKFFLQHIIADYGAVCITMDIKKKKENFLSNFN